LSRVEIVLDPDRFEIGKPKRKRKYTQQQHQMQPPSGPSSASPGPWVSEAIVNGWPLDKKDPEKSPEYRNAVAVRDSYRQQYAFGPVVFPPVDDSPNFPMVEHPSILAGKSWLISPLRQRSLHKLTRHAEEMESCEDIEHEGSLYSLNDDGEVEDVDDHEERVEVDFSEVDQDEENEVKKIKKVKSSSSPVTVSDETMDVVYRKWFSEPSHGNHQILWETLHNFLSKKSTFARKGDDLRTQGVSDDFQMDLMLKLLRVLEKMRVRGRIILQPAHYLTRTWTNCRITALKNLTKENRKHPSILELRSKEADPLDDDAPTIADLAESQRWQNGNNSDENSIDDQEAADEALLQQREGKRAALAPDLADVAGMYLEGMKQKQIAEKKGISQQAVSKKLLKVRQQLKAMPDVVVSK
jgi:DNA-directed RNA polymerase specialized sigma24 family protein